MVQQIQISDELWKHLNINKNPGESFDDVIIRLFKLESIINKLKEVSKG
jgi:predicted CopG family antitoxin